MDVLHSREIPARLLVLCRLLGTLDVWFAHVGIVICSRILGEISKFDAFIVGPSEGEE
jgi:hypothetical protein